MTATHIDYLTSGNLKIISSASPLVIYSAFWATEGIILTLKIGTKRRTLIYKAFHLSTW